MKIKSLLEVLQAAHWTDLVESEWEERGGIMLVAPPASLKTTIINSLDDYHDSLVLSDINVQSIIRLRDDIANRRYRTLAFTEFEKIYQRNPQVATNVEGHIKAFAEEGFKMASFEDARMPGIPARCLIIGGLTPSCMRRNWERWTENGFARRFLWVNYSMMNGGVIADSIAEWKKLSLEFLEILTLRNKMIPYNLTPQESNKIRSMCKHQRGQETPYVLLKKIACVLKRRDETLKQHPTFMATMADFAEGLSPDGAKLTI